MRILNLIALNRSLLRAAVLVAGINHCEPAIAQEQSLVNLALQKQLKVYGLERLLAVPRSDMVPGRIVKLLEGRADGQLKGECSVEGALGPDAEKLKLVERGKTLDVTRDLKVEAGFSLGVLLNGRGASINPDFRYIQTVNAAIGNAVLLELPTGSLTKAQPDKGCVEGIQWTRKQYPNHPLRIVTQALLADATYDVVFNASLDVKVQERVLGALSATLNGKVVGATRISSLEPTVWAITLDEPMWKLFESKFVARTVSIDQALPERFISPVVLTRSDESAPPSSHLLTAQFSHVGPVPDRWYMGGRRDKPAWILRSATKGGLTFTNEFSHETTGRLISPKEVFADGWSGGLAGAVVSLGKVHVILWDNGTWWSTTFFEEIPASQGTSPIRGDYWITKQKRPCYIDELGSKAIELINENKARSRGRIIGIASLIADDWEGGLLGRYIQGGSTLLWRNGTWWGKVLS